MKLTDYILKNFKIEPDVIEISSITPYDIKEIIRIDYIVFDENIKRKYQSKTKYFDKNELTPIIRQYNLDNILEKSPTNQEIMLDENILDESSRKKVEASRVDQHIHAYARIHELQMDQPIHAYARIHELQMDYSKNFQIGQRVKYKGQDSIITFLHEGYDSKDMTRWSIDTKGVETRYVSGLLLVNNPKGKMWSDIKPSKRLLNMSTERLLDEMKFTRFRNKQVFMEAKYVLSTREHVVRKRK